MLKNFLILIAASILVMPLAAQNDYCGTIPHKKESLIEFQQNKDQWAAPRGDDPFYVRVVCHIVGNDDGSGYVNREKLFQQSCETNEVFEQFGVIFYIDEIKYINNSTYYDHSYQEGVQMMYENNVSGAVNLYFVEDPAGNCGYYSRQADAIALNDGCLNKGSYTWSHELGHYFSLPHTFHGWEGRDYDPNVSTPTYVDGKPTEKVDGSNCVEAADGFCDTPPDYLSYRWSCNSDSLSTITLKDINDEQFRAEGEYIMSYSNSGCRATFSQEQINAMKYDMIQVRNLSGNEPSSPLLDTFEITNVNPVNEEEIYFDDVTFSWEEVEGAIGYMVKYTPFDNFDSRAKKIYTDDPFAEPDTIYPTWKKISWKVKPIGKINSCMNYGEVNTFRTVTTSTESAELKRNRTLYPNPLKPSRILNISTTDVFSNDVNIKIYNSTGQLVKEIESPSSYGSVLNINIQNLKAGVHMVQLQSEKGRSTHKLMILE